MVIKVVNIEGVVGFVGLYCFGVVLVVVGFVMILVGIMLVILFGMFLEIINFEDNGIVFWIVLFDDY